MSRAYIVKVYNYENVIVDSTHIAGSNAMEAFENALDADLIQLPRADEYTVSVSNYETAMQIIFKIRKTV